MGRQILFRAIVFFHRGIMPQSFLKSLYGICFKNMRESQNAAQQIHHCLITTKSHYMQVKLGFEFLYMKRLQHAVMDLKSSNRSWRTLYFVNQGSCRDAFRAQLCGFSTKYCMCRHFLQLPAAPGLCI